jgi:hypothetical protein
MAEDRRRKNERALPSEEKREGKSKKPEPPSRGPCSLPSEEKREGKSKKPEPP